MSDDVRWDEALAELAEAVEGNLSAHADPASLVALHRDELPAEEAEALREHLAWCRQCSELARAWTDFAAGESEPVDPDERSADWEALLERMAAGRVPDDPPGAEEPSTQSPDRVPDPTPGPTPDRAPPRVPPPEDPRSTGLRLAAGLAAALVVVVGGAAAFWFLGPGERGRDLGRPQPNVPLYDLVPPGMDRSAAEEGTTLELEASPVLILNTRQPLDDRRYEALVQDREGRRILTVPGLEPTEFGNLTLRLPAGSLDPGRYTIDLRPEGGGPVLERYPVRVVE